MGISGAFFGIPPLLNIVTGIISVLSALKSNKKPFPTFLLRTGFAICSAQTRRPNYNLCFIAFTLIFYLGNKKSGHNYAGLKSKSTYCNLLTKNKLSSFKLLAFILKNNLISNNDPDNSGH